MGPALDALATQPLNTRRPAAPTLPSFELPPPPFGLVGAAPKYPAYPNHPPTSHPPTNVSVGNLLTPPATNQSGETSTVSHQLAPSSAADLPQTYWTSTGTTPYGAPSAQWASGINPPYSARSSFSPSGVVGRSAAVTSPPTTDGLPQPFEAPPMASFQQGLPAPPSTISPSGSLPVTMGLYPSGHASSPAPLPSNDPYAPKAHSLYHASAHIANPHQTGYSTMYGGPHSMGSAGLGIHPTGRMGQQSPGGQLPLAFPRQPWPSYSLPAMNGPVMTNVHSPNSPMSVMGGMQPGLLPGFNSGHVANAQHLYGAHPPPHGLPPPAADRPFKCDQCPQSFNRNHDLKRHKRIHLAVKPFPCAHCDKSFSRKDALKRHILVKGCGKDGDSDVISNQTAADGTIKGEGPSEDGSPVMNGRI
ncbi:hypothetical protein N7462_001141 [Penicillium macrosclerotiorum]|uniref:uncharacterized protein n=1 Tax=Penicillium macrosclerotiorum TaxID=303699 RepID=UPI002546BEDF|nr:uncharacterized protein N7462_001141 [Penicillium macrosclerotiorum]KAJ5699136.1 hypothetical protein N7462_001141 [Penicillium macrosclerotiorum]